MKSEKIKNLFIDVIMFALGSICIGIATACFVAPNKLAPGGVTGISIVLNYLFGWSIGSLNLLFNIPLFIWAFLEFKGRWKTFLMFISKTFIATVFSSIGIKVMEDVVKYFKSRGVNLVYSDDIVVATLVASILTGIGLALVLMRGGTTGGTDLIAKLANMHLRHVSIGQLLMLSNLVIVLAAAVVYQEVSSPIYSCVVIFVATKIVDFVLYGASPATGKLMFVVSEKSNEISTRIMNELHRGVTHLKSHGGFESKDGEVLLCALRKNEVYKAYELIHEVDQSAFAIVSEAGEITGLGFGERLNK